MRRVLLTIGLLLALATPVQAAITIVSGQLIVARVNDAAVTMPSGWTAGNHIFLLSVINSQTQTLSITGINATPTVVGPGFLTDTTNSLRSYALCWPTSGDVGDNSFNAVTSGSGNVLIIVAEVSGASCNGSGEGHVGQSTSAQSHTSPTLTTTHAGALMFSVVHGTSTTDYTATSGTPVGSAGVGSNGDLMGGDNVGVALTSYQILGAAGPYVATYTSTNNENGFITAAAIAPAATSGGGGLFFFGCCEVQQ